jgi:hypothetical protein
VAKEKEPALLLIKNLLLLFRREITGLSGKKIDRLLLHLLWHLLL